MAVTPLGQDLEGAEYVNQAIRFLARPAEHDSRTPAQRRADALVAMARFVVEHHDVPTGVKRRQPKIVATIPYEDLMACSRVGWLGSHEITPRRCGVWPVMPGSTA
jgi:hypothetical protein